MTGALATGKWLGWRRGQVDVIGGASYVNE
jgi:hypothetical protein